MEKNKIIGAIAGAIVIIFTVGSFFYWVSGVLSDVPVIDQRQNKWIQRQTEMHNDFDAHKIESIKERHKLELRIKALEVKLLHLQHQQHFPPESVPQH